METSSILHLADPHLNQTGTLGTHITGHVAVMTFFDALKASSLLNPR
jgi:hypothetical protein